MIKRILLTIAITIGFLIVAFGISAGINWLFKVIPLITSIVIILGLVVTVFFGVKEFSKK